MHSHSSGDRLRIRTDLLPFPWSLLLLTALGVRSVPQLLPLLLFEFEDDTADVAMSERKFLKESTLLTLLLLPSEAGVISSPSLSESAPPPPPPLPPRAQW